MQKIIDDMIQKSQEMLKSGAVCAVFAWKKGNLVYDVSPAVFSSSDELLNIHYDDFCASNLSKYLVAQEKPDGTSLVFLKPCDTYSLNQLLSENQVSRDKVYAVGIGCAGKLDINKLSALGITGILEIDDDGDGENLTIKTLYGDKSCARQSVYLDKCLNCKGKEHKVFDELIGESISDGSGDGLSSGISENDRFSPVADIESKSSDERFAFWRGELSKCVRCNACRDVCPACTCRKCIFDNVGSGVRGKVNASEFEENLYHIIRGYHVAGRCSDCGECSRVCPQSIPLHLINRKFIKDINSFFGEFQVGETSEFSPPLLRFDFDDAEPGDIIGREGD